MMMTESQFEKWQNFISWTIEFVVSLQMRIFPIYLETPTVYSYTVDGDGVEFEVYDLPLADMLENAEDRDGFLKHIKQYSNSEQYNMVLREVSPNTEDESMSIIVPKNVCSVRSFGGKNVVLIDNNILHIKNPFITDILDFITDNLYNGYCNIIEDEND